MLAYEEAIGYAIGPEVRDKDGLSAARGGRVDGRGVARRGGGPCSTSSTTCTAATAPT